MNDDERAGHRANALNTLCREIDELEDSVDRLTALMPERLDGNLFRLVAGLEAQAHRLAIRLAALGELPTDELPTDESGGLFRGLDGHLHLRR